MLSQIFDTLVATGKDGQPIPRLATRWENPDDLTWIFYLREDAYWHDGNAVFPRGKAARSRQKTSSTPWKECLILKPSRPSSEL